GSRRARTTESVAIARNAMHASNVSTISILTAAMMPKKCHRVRPSNEEVSVQLFAQVYAALHLVDAIAPKSAAAGFLLRGTFDGARKYFGRGRRSRHSCRAGRALEAGRLQRE